MPLRLDIRGQAAHKYLPYAKTKLKQLKEKLARSGRKWLSEATIVDDGVRIFIQAGTTDLIRIVAAGKIFPMAWLDDLTPFIGIGRPSSDFWLVMPDEKGQYSYLGEFLLTTSETPNFTRRGDLPDIGNHLTFTKVPLDSEQAYAMDAFTLGATVDGGPPPGLPTSPWVPPTEKTEALFRAFDLAYKQGLDNLLGYRGEGAWLHWHINYINRDTGSIFDWFGGSFPPPEWDWIFGEILIRITQGFNPTCVDSELLIGLPEALCAMEPVLDGQGNTVDYTLLLNFGDAEIGKRTGDVPGASPVYPPDCEGAAAFIFATVRLRTLLTLPLKRFDNGFQVNPIRDLAGIASVYDCRGAVGGQLGVSSSHIVEGDYTWFFSMDGTTNWPRNDPKGRLGYWRSSALSADDRVFFNLFAEYHTHTFTERSLKDGLYSAHAVTTVNGATIDRDVVRSNDCIIDEPFDEPQRNFCNFGGSFSGNCAVVYMQTTLQNGQLVHRWHGPQNTFIPNNYCYQQMYDSYYDCLLQVFRNRYEYSDTLPNATQCTHYLDETGALAVAFTVSVPGQQYLCNSGDWTSPPIPAAPGTPECGYTPEQPVPCQSLDINPYTIKQVSWLPHKAFFPWLDPNVSWPLGALTYTQGAIPNLISHVKFMQTFGADGYGNVYINGELLYTSSFTWFAGSSFSNVYDQGNRHFATNGNWFINSKYSVGYCPDTVEPFYLPHCGLGFPEIPEPCEGFIVGGLAHAMGTTGSRNNYPPSHEWKGHIFWRFWDKLRSLPRSDGNFDIVFRFLVWPNAVGDDWGFCVFAYEDPSAANTAWSNLLNLLENPDSTPEQIADARTQLRASRVLIANNFATEELMDMLNPGTSNDSTNQTVWINTIWQP